jgi:hypothetical protein
VKTKQLTHVIAQDSCVAMLLAAASCDAIEICMILPVLQRKIKNQEKPQGERLKGRGSLMALIKRNLRRDSSIRNQEDVRRRILSTDTKDIKPRILSSNPATADFCDPPPSPGLW